MRLEALRARAGDQVVLIDAVATDADSARGLAYLEQRHADLNETVVDVVVDRGRG